ncbi:MAG: glycosyltransferase [Acidobacteriota bacterium]
MKVLHVIPALAPRYGGPSMAAMEMVAALRELDVDAMIATTDADGRSRLSVPIAVETVYRGVPAIFFRRNWNEPFGYSSGLAAWLTREVQRFDIVHVHAIFSHPCIAAARACRNASIPFIVRPLGALDPWSLRRRKLAKKVLWAFGVFAMLRDAAVIHYTTEAEKRLAEERLKLRNGIVIPIGIRLEEYQTRREPGEEQKWKPYVLVLSRLHPKKGLDVLIPAFLRATCDPSFNHWKLVLAGDGCAGHVEQLRRLAGGSGRVLFPGWLMDDQKIAAIQNAECLALPSRQENFGLCVLEAMACSVPVLVTPEVNLSQMVSEFLLGWACKLDEGGLEYELKHIMSSNDRQLRGSRGKRLAEGYSRSVCTSRLVSTYHGILPACSTPALPGGGS